RSPLDTIPSGGPADAAPTPASRSVAPLPSGTPVSAQARASASTQSRLLDAQATMTALPGTAGHRPRPTWTRRPEPRPSSTPAPTRTARPRTSSTPGATAVPYIPPTIRNGDNKWGVGLYKDSNRVIDMLRETQPGVVLLMDPSEGWARRVRETVPS